MQVGIKRFGLILIFTGGFFFSPICYAQQPTIESVGKYGTINWVEQKVMAAGLGVPGEAAQNPAQARAMAQRAAVVVARRNLLEVVKGMRIDSATRVNDYAVQDDTVVSKVKGVLNNSTVEGYTYKSNGAVEATVIMPFSGQLNEILIPLATHAVGRFKNTFNTQTVDNRIRKLEDRVKALEDKLGGMRQLNFEQQQAILLFKQLAVAWAGYMSSSPHLIPMGYESDSILSGLINELKEQAAKVAELTRRLNDMTLRLTALETSARQPTVKPETVKSSRAVSFTGLVIDARQTEFRPCLKPEIYCQGHRIYPGDYVNLQNAVRNGYVRYYRKIENAQQSPRSGSLPLTITAKGTYQGSGALEIGDQEFDMLKTFIEAPDSFLADCNVVIVF